MAIICFLASGEPPFALPNIALFLASLDDSHPPIDEKDNHKANTPLNENPHPVKDTKEEKPQTAVFAFDIRKLNAVATAFGALLI